jgi:hypothetical protein
MPKMMGAPFEPGEEVYVFVYSPRTSFYLQKAKVIDYFPDEDDYELEILNKAIGNTKVSYSIGKYKVRGRSVKSKTYVKNVLKKYGKKLISDIFGEMSKRKK